MPKILMRSTLFISTFLILVFENASSQMLLNDWQIEDVHGPSQVGIVDSIAVDLNQDGLMDVVSASIDDGHVRAYINQGQFKFEQRYISTDVLGAYRIIPTDLNLDDKADFLVPSIQSQEVVALIADHQSKPFGYRKQVIAGNILLPTDTQAGDFNNDGLVDVVSISFEENKLLLHLQDNQGGFMTTVISESPQRPRKIVVADFNHDQLADILVASSEDNSVRLFSNAGNLTFREILISDQLTGIRYISPCNISGDDYPGFVAGVTDANQVKLFTNNGHNNFSVSIIDEDLPGADVVKCVHLDQDRELELISISRLFDSIYTQEISGPQNKQLIANARDGYINATVADFEKIGSPLILTQSFFENRNLIYAPRQNNQEQVVWEDFPDGVSYVEAGDIDGDGDQDFVYTAFRGDKVYWSEQTAEGYKPHTIFASIDGPQSVKISDIDQDGDLDVFSAGAWDDRFYFHQNQGKGQFETYVVSDSANNPARIEIMDVNGDLKLDVVTTSSLDDSLRWFDVDGVQFTETVIDSELDGALALKTDDINEDGLEDIIVGSYFGNNITAFYNEGVGQFIKQELSQNKTKPTSILSADIDDDSDIDIVFNALNDQSVWLLHNTAGSFQEILINQRDENIRDVAFIDIDLDGDQDVIDVSDQTGIININTNIDGFSFQSRVLTQVPFGVSAVISPFKYGSKSPRFAIASNRNNSLQILTLSDLIFKSGFDLSQVP